MGQLTKAAFLTKYGDAAGMFATTGTGTISGADLREFSTDLDDSVAFNLDGAIKRAAVNVAGGATLRGVGTAPATIIAAPGANKYLAIHRIVASYNYSTTPYDFTGSQSLQFIVGSGNIVAQIVYTTMDEANDWNIIVGDYYDTSNMKLTTNTALTLTTTNGTNCTTGVGDLDIVVYYSIEDVNV